MADRAPTEKGVGSAKSQLLIYLQDEPKDVGGTELDDANVHNIRVGLVDLCTGKKLLRLRRRVDPSWVSLKRRSRFARGLSGCSVALDVRAAAQLAA